MTVPAAGSARTSIDEGGQERAAEGADIEAGGRGRVASQSSTRRRRRRLDEQEVGEPEPVDHVAVHGMETRGAHALHALPSRASSTATGSTAIHQVDGVGVLEVHRSRVDRDDLAHVTRSSAQPPADPDTAAGRR